MKLSEFFGKVLGDKDVDIPDDVPTVPQEPSKDETPAPTPIKPKDDPTKEEFEALNARIKELEAANQKLIMQGTLDETKHEQSVEEIIMDLCVDRRKNGSKIDS